MADLTSAIQSGLALGRAFGGNSDSYNQAYARTAQRDALLAEAQARRQKQMALESLPKTLSAAGYDQPTASVLQQAILAGVDPTKLSGYKGDIQEQGFRGNSVASALAGDWAGANANLMGVANGPVELAAIQGQNLINNRLLPGGGGVSTTDQGRAGMAADQARAAASYASANSSNAAAKSALGRLAIAQQQAALQQAGNWAPGRNFAAAGGATGAAATKKSGDELKAAFANQGLAQDAYNFAGALLGKKPEDVQKMTPQQIRDAVAAGGRWSSGPILGRTPGIGAIFNSDLEAYANSAAGKQARLNNPTGPVTNADFDVARKSVFSPEKPDRVNADLLYQALSRVGGGDVAPQTPAAPVRRAVNPTTGKTIILVNGQWVPE